MLSTGTMVPPPTTPWATSLLAAQQQQEPTNRTSSPLQSSIAPSNSTSQVSNHQQRSHRTPNYDIYDLTNASLSDEENQLHEFACRLLIVLMFSVYCLGHKCRQWTASCYPYFEKAKLHRDQEGKVIKVRSEDGKLHPNYYFKCKQCVLSIDYCRG
jgi:hypothetical protein